MTLDVLVHEEIHQGKIADEPLTEQIIHYLLLEYGLELPISHGPMGLKKSRL